MPMSEPKCDPPVRTNSDSPRTFAISFQRVQPKCRLIHVLNPFRGIERREDQPQPVELISLKLPSIIMLKQELQAFMTEVLNHRLDCKTSFDICQQQRAIADVHDRLCEQALNCSGRSSNQPGAHLGTGVLPLPSSTRSLVALFSVRRAISWPGPLGRSPLVLARLHGSRLPQSRACPLPVAEPAARRPRLHPSCRVSGLSLACERATFTLTQEVSTWPLKCNVPFTRFSAPPCVRRSGGMRASAARFTRSRCPAPSWMRRGIRRAPARSARTTSPLSRPWSGKRSSGFVSTRCSRLTAASGLRARGSPLAV